jgi:SAM-dependent methyltransferase
LEFESSPKPLDSYDPAMYADLLAVEERHFWFRARNRAILSIFRPIEHGLDDGYRVLEVGCGDGNVLRALCAAAGRGTVIGMDIHLAGLAIAQHRAGSANLICADIAHPPFAHEFEVIGLFDVLEHLDDDVGALRASHELLKPRGALLITVPAGPELWSYFDVASHHKRRYTITGLNSKLRSAGFSIERLSAFMSPLYPLLWISRRVLGRDAGRNADPMHSWDIARADLRVRPITGTVLEFLLKQELRLLSRGWKPPIGPSLVGVARPAD